MGDRAALIKSLAVNGYSRIINRKEGKMPIATKKRHCDCGCNEIIFPGNFFTIRQGSFYAAGHAPRATERTAADIEQEEASREHHENQGDLFENINL
jgi:hypothetical protein